MKKLISFVFLFLSFAVFFSCNDEKKNLPNLGEHSKVVRINTTIGLSSSKAFGISAQRGSEPQGTNMSLENIFSSDDWDNTTNKPKMYFVVDNQNVVEISSNNYQYKKSINGNTSVEINITLTFNSNADKVRFYLVDKTVSVDVNNASLMFPNQNNSVKALNVGGDKPKYKLSFYGETTVANLLNKTPFALNPLGTFILFSTNNTGYKDLTIPDNTSVNLTTDCFTFSGSINMRTGKNASSDTSSGSLTFNLSNGGGETVKASSRGLIYGLYVLGKSKTSGTIRLPLTDEFFVKKTITNNFQESYNGKSVSLNIDGAKYFIIRVGKGTGLNRQPFTQWTFSNNKIQYAYRALDNNNNPIGEWVDNVPSGTNDYLARIYDPDNNSIGSIRCPYNITRVVQWGTMKWISTRSLFTSCSKLIFIDTSTTSPGDKPDFSQCIDMSNMFFSCREFKEYINPDFFDTSNVENMNSMFRSATAYNQDLSGLHVGRVRTHTDFSTETSLAPNQLPHWSN